MMITQTHDNGGTFDMTLFLSPEYTFTRTRDCEQRTLRRAAIELSVSGAPWVNTLTDPDLTAGPGKVFAPNDGVFVPGVEELAPPDQERDEPILVEPPTQPTQHVVTPPYANVPPLGIVHGAFCVSFYGHAWGGYIDPKIESTDGAKVDLGLDTFNIVFNVEPFGDADLGPVTPVNFTIEETGGALPPNVTGATKVGNTVTVVLDRHVTIEEWTTIVCDVYDGAGLRIIDGGNEGPGVDEAARLDVGYLPGDITQDGLTQPIDLSRLIGMVNGTRGPTGDKGVLEDYADISRDGLIQVLDISRMLAILSGSPPATKNWQQDDGMNNPRP